MLQLLQQQRDDSQAQGAADQADRASVGCQTRQGDTWRVQIEGCLGKSGEDMGSWAYHGMTYRMPGTVSEIHRHQSNIPHAERIFAFYPSLQCFNLLHCFELAEERFELVFNIVTWVPEAESQ